MADSKSIEPEEERELKSKELEMRVEHYKHYITIALQANAFYYVTTGGVLGFYLKYTFESLPIPNLEFFLLLPILFGSVLGGIFFYGAELQVKAVENLDDVRDELRNRLGLSVKRFYDAHLLVILLNIFSVIFFLVVAALLILPLLSGRIYWSEKLQTLVTSTNPLTMWFFYLVAVIILIGGFLIPRIARRLERNLKARRNTNWLRTILKAKIWLQKIELGQSNITELEDQDFYHSLRQFLNKKTLESIDKKDWGLTQFSLEKETNEFYSQLERKRERQPEMFEENEEIKQLENELKPKTQKPENEKNYETEISGEN